MILQRLQLSRNAIMKVREQIEIRHPRSTLLSDKGLWGMIGLIDYIQTGDLEKILEPTLQRQVKKIHVEAWETNAKKTIAQVS